MLINQDRIAEFTQVMLKETTLFELILAEETLMSMAIRERKWESLEKAIRAIDALENELKGIEAVRELIFESLRDESGLGLEATFYQWAVHLPEAERRQITDIYRNLKGRAFAARAQGAAITSYLTESRTVLAGIMEELFPHKRGRIYDKRGGRKEAEMTKVVLDKAL
jgi:hypothetical protein